MEKYSRTSTPTCLPVPALGSVNVERPTLFDLDVHSHANEHVLIHEHAHVSARACISFPVSRFGIVEKCKTSCEMEMKSDDEI